ncbi:hypothetical protein ECPA4_3267, partial [Escherichia coli PA4]
HHLRDYPVLLRNNTILIGLQDVCRPQSQLCCKRLPVFTAIMLSATTQTLHKFF